MSDFIEVNGFKWPANDTECRKVVFNTTRDMHGAIAMCKGYDVVVQAGGNCGVWPAYLAKHFDRVWTFEPDPVNFECLKANVPTNVRYQMAALGENHGRCDLHRIPRNIGAHSVKENGMAFDVLTIDSLGLEKCDYICLDIEGYELKALKGAAATIRKFHPVIQIEDKGLSEPYGTKKGDAERWLASEFGYEVKQRVHRDVILA